MKFNPFISFFSNMKSFFLVVENRGKKRLKSKSFVKTKPDKKVEGKKTQFVFVAPIKILFFFSTKQNEKDDAFKHSRLFEIWIQTFFWDRSFFLFVCSTQTSVIFLFSFWSMKNGLVFHFGFSILEKSLFCDIVVLAPSHFLHDKPASNILVVVRK